MKDRIKPIVAGIVLFVILSVIVSLIFGFPVMLLWNWLIPDIFGFKSITYLQASGLFLLCALLFQTRLNGNSN